MSRILFALLITALSASAQNLMPARQTDVSTNSFQTIRPVMVTNVSGIVYPPVTSVTASAQAVFDWADDNFATRDWVDSNFAGFDDFAAFTNAQRTAITSGTGTFVRVNADTVQATTVNATDGNFQSLYATNVYVNASLIVGTNEPPTKVGPGPRCTIWFDTNAKLIKFWNGSAWVAFGAGYL